MASSLGKDKKNTSACYDVSESRATSPVLLTFLLPMIGRLMLLLVCGTLFFCMEEERISPGKCEFVSLQLHLFQEITRAVELLLLLKLKLKLYRLDIQDLVY